MCLARSRDTREVLALRWFFLGRGTTNPSEIEGTVPGDEAQCGVSPAQRFPALPAVFGALGSPEGSARCLFAQPGVEQDRLGSAARLHFAVQMLSACPRELLGSACPERFLLLDPWHWGAWPGDATERWPRCEGATGQAGSGWSRE